MKNNKDSLLSFTEDSYNQEKSDMSYSLECVNESWETKK